MLKISEDVLKVPEGIILLLSLGLTSTINQSFSHVLKYFTILARRAKDPFKTSSNGIISY